VQAILSPMLEVAMAMFADEVFKIKQSTCAVEGL